MKLHHRKTADEMRAKVELEKYRLNDVSLINDKTWLKQSNSGYPNFFKPYALATVKNEHNGT